MSATILRRSLDSAAVSSALRAPWLAVAGLLAAVAVWGVSFVVLRAALAGYPLVGLLFLRFLIGGGALLAASLLRPSSRPSLRQLPLLRLAAVGSALAVGYLAQTAGLYLGVSPALAATLTSLVVIFAPAWEWVVAGVVPNRAMAVGAVVAVAGTAMVSQGTSLSGSPHLFVGLGLELLSAAAFGMQVVLVGRLGREVSPTLLGAGQLLMVSLILLPLVPFTGGLPIPGPAELGAILFCALGASAFSFAVQAAAQRRLSAEAAALVMATEPAFALVAGAFAGIEQLQVVSCAGILLLLAGSAGSSWVARASSLPARLRAGRGQARHWLARARAHTLS